ncbi:MAG: hypothetical protein [Caudoviricetes sp.]|nr:MAG: hypothetical protein [Caudoviricetes sp.]
MNRYNKDHPLQIKWDEASRMMMCLCTMRESCVHCCGEGVERRRNKMNDVIVEARSKGYQLRHKDGRMIKMVRQTSSGYELD